MADQDILTLGRELGLEGKELQDFLRDERQNRREEQHYQANRKKEEDERALFLVREQLKLEEARGANRSTGGGSDNGAPPNAPLFHKLMPPFDEKKDDMDAYLLRFERLALVRNWPETEWASALSLYLAGEALEVYARLPPTDSVDYSKLRTALLLRFRLTEDGFREKFRNSNPKDGETATQYLARLSTYIERWVELSQTEKEYDNLRDLIIKEQFLNKCEHGLALFLRERTYPNLEEVGTAADRFIEAQNYNHVGGKKKSTSSSRAPAPIQPTNPGAAGKPTEEKKRIGPCYICSKTGHIAAECRQNVDRNIKCLKCGRLGHRSSECRTRGFSYKEGQSRSATPKVESAAITCLYTPEGEKIDVVVTTMQKPDDFFVVPGMPVVHGLINNKKGTILRDSGCNTVIVNEQFLQPGQFTGETKAIHFLDHGAKLLSEAEVVIDTPYFKGNIKALVMRNPLYDLTLGNIVGVRGPDNPDRGWTEAEKVLQEIKADFEIDQKPAKEKPKVMTKVDIRKPKIKHSVGHREDQQQAETESKEEGREPVKKEKNVVTKGIEYEPQRILLGPNNKEVQINSVLYSERVDESTNQEVNVVTRAQARKATGEHNPKTLKVAKINLADVSPAEVIDQQGKDKTLKNCFEKVDKPWRQGKLDTEYMFLQKRNILYRRKMTRSGTEVDQLVVPSKYRAQVMQLAHDALMAAHLGAKKTCDRVGKEFFWPGMTSDITRYVKSCDICQRTLPRGLVPKAPLGEVPLVDTPFQKVAIDIVGPLHPRTDRGYSYILTLTDYATRYPEAVALKNIDTVTVADALVDIFSRVGVPQEILHDQGTQFVSQLMKETCRLLSIKQLTTTPYHPMCNGLVEKFNGTLKKMVRRLCSERPKDWDRYIAPAMFAYREVPQESTGFSPFELLYGRQVRGPLTILKELWTGEDTSTEVKTLYQYVIELRERLEETCQLTHEELRKSATRYKQNYDKRSKERQFNLGDKVLLLLPTDHNQLITQWKGPFPVVGKISNRDYKIDMGSKVKTFHVNMLKKYEQRSTKDHNPKSWEENVQLNAVLLTEDKTYETDDYLIPTIPQNRETVEDVVLDKDLTPYQQENIRKLLKEYPDVFVNIPGRTQVEECHLKLNTEQPIYTKQYPIPHAVKEEINKEVDRMLDLGIIEESKSPYNSPVLLTKKPDGTHRLCIDFRNINKVTEVIAEPMDRPLAIFDKLQGDRYFSKIDLTKGYWQIPMSQESREKTAFSTDNAHYHFRYVPFGINTAPAVFTRAMRKVLNKIRHVDNFLDDILIHTRTWREHLTALQEVCSRLRETGFTARPPKCILGSKKLEFLGHEVGEGVIRPTDTLIQKVRQAIRPTTKKQLRAFLGLTGFYRSFIPGYASIAAPLTDLTKKGCPNKNPWVPEAEKAFDTLKQSITSKPVLQLPNFEKGFTLRTDASNTGLGAVLLQKDFEDILHPIAYASRKLLQREVAYSTLEKECLAIVWALQKFHVYLYGRDFKIQTDHQPLTCLQQSFPKNNRLKRWAILIQEYQFTIEVIKGRDNVGADFLSRSEEGEAEKTSPST